MSHVRAVMWKEWRELRAQSGEVGGVAMTAAVLLMLGVVGSLAATAGREAVHTFIPVLIAGIPILGIMAPVCESFAGERERHTLETLLASAIRSEALLVGKILAHVVYGWLGSIILVVIFVAGANATSPLEPWDLPSLASFLIVLLVMPLLLVALSAAGALVSLRAPTVRNAVSKLMVGFISLFIPIMLLSKFVPLSRMENAQRLLATESGRVLTVVSFAMIIACADVLLILIAWARFRRDKLIEIR